MTDTPKPLFSFPALPKTEETVPGTPLFSFGAPASDASPPKERGMLDNAPDDDMVSSTLKGAGTALIKGVSSIPGVVGDLREGGKMLSRYAVSKITGKSPEEQEADGKRLREKAGDTLVGKALSIIPSTNSMPSGHDIAKHPLKKTGDYEPQSRWGKYGMLALEALPAAFAPSKLAGKVATLATAKEALKSTTKAAPLMTTAAPAADAAAEYTGDPLAAMAAGIAAPVAVGKTGSTMAKAMPTVTAKGKQAAADKLLADAATDPNAAIDAVNNRRPGDVGTLGEVTGDKGLAISEHRAQSLDDKFRQGLSDIKDKQNTQRIDVIKALEPGGDPRTVSRAFDQHLDDITGTFDRALTAAEERARNMSQQIPTARPEDLGATQRELLQHHMEEANRARRALYDAVDPDGTLAIVTQPFVVRAGEIAASHPSTSAELSARTMDPFTKAAALGPETSYRDLRGLDENITGAMRKAKIDGADNEVRLLTQLKTAIKKSMDDAVDNHVAREAGAVQRGEMPQEATLAARLQEQIDAFYRARDAGAATASATGTGPTVASPASGTARPGETGSGNAPGGEGVPGGPTPFDVAARERLNTANAAHKAYVEQYKMGAPGKITETTGFVGSPKIYDTAVVDKAFTPGHGGYETAGHVMQGSGPDGPAIMQQMAVQKLREAMPADGLLDQRSLDAWRNKYSGALRAIDEVSPGWSRQFEGTAQATEAIGTVEAARKAAIAAEQTGVAKKFLGLKESDDIVAEVGTILNSNTSGSRSAELVGAMRGDPEALAGVRRSGVDWMINNFSTAGVRDGERVLSGPRLLEYFGKHKDAIRNVYGEEGLANMRAIVEDVMRGQQAQTTAMTAGSDTAAKLHKHMQAAADASSRQNTINNVLNFGIWDALSSMNPAKIAMVVGGKQVLGLIENLRSRGIRDINDLVVQGMLNPEVGRAMLQRAVSPNGTPNIAGYAAVLGALDAAKDTNWPASGEGLTIDMKRRAAGGRIGAIDHEAEAARYVRLAARAKTLHGKKTESFLKVPDAAVAKALAVAHEAL